MCFDMTHNPRNLSLTQTPCLLSPDLGFHIHEHYPEKSECPGILAQINLIVRHWKCKQCFMLPLGSSWNPKASYCIPRNRNSLECQRIQWIIHFVSTFQLLQFWSSKQPYPERSHSILDKAAPSVPKRCHPTPSPIQFHPNSFNKRQAILL